MTNGDLDELVAALDPLGGAGEEAGPVPTPPPAPLPARARRAAVLALLTAGEQPDLLFTERASTLRHHAGQVSFPGGRIDAGDAGPEDAALREAQEEIGLDPRRVHLLGRLPGTALTRAFNVTVVVGSWSGDQDLVASPDEVAQVLRYPLRRLADPQVRRSARHPSGGVGPAFVLDDIVIWGFTAHLTDRLLDLGGYQLDWDQGRTISVPERFLRR